MKDLQRRVLLVFALLVIAPSFGLALDTPFYKPNSGGGGGGGVSISSITASSNTWTADQTFEGDISCTDCIDGDDLADDLTLDAAFTVSGASVTISTSLRANEIVLGGGSLSLPAIRFGGDTDTGIYNTSSNNLISFAVGGTNVVNMSPSELAMPSSGVMSTSNGTDAVPGFKFGGTTGLGIRNDTGDLVFVRDGIPRQALGATAGIYNPAMVNYDLQVRGDNDVFVIHVDASADSVGFGTQTPEAKVHVFRSAGTAGSNLVVSTGTTDIFEVNGASVAVSVSSVAFNGAVLNWVTVGTSSPVPVGNMAGIFAIDAGGTTEMKSFDEAGNYTLISPHDRETGEWIFYSENVFTGKKVRVNMERFIRRMEELTGESFFEIDQRGQ